MRSFNAFPAVASAAVLSLGVIACGSSPKHTVKGQREPVSSGLHVKAKYFQNGTRVLQIGGTENGNIGADIFEFCDGSSLVEETLPNEGSDNSLAVSAMSRTVDFAGCTDERLTPSDFAVSGGHNASSYHGNVSLAVGGDSYMGDASNIGRR